MKKINKKALKIFKEVEIICGQLFGDKLHDMYLYGSYARGDYDKESDVDILLTLDLTDKQIMKYRSIISKMDSRIGLKYDIVVMTIMVPLKRFTQFSEDLPFYRNVIKEGIRLYGN